MGIFDWYYTSKSAKIEVYEALNTKSIGNI